MSLRNPSARFILDHKGPKTDCPSCGHKKTFRGYIDRATNERLPAHVGVCDRMNNCGYTYGALQFVRDGGEVANVERQYYVPPPPPKRTDWRCPREFVDYTHKEIKNNFLVWLEKTIGPNKLAETYRVGTFPKGKNYPHYEGAMVYWQVGEDGLERSGKVIQYGHDGKRVKELKAAWMHSIVTGKTMDELGCAQVYFGTHLLKEFPEYPVAIVESEKSAMICSWFYPQYIWLATGGSNMISVEKSMCLAGRDVYLFPDVGCYKDWCAAALKIDPLCKSCEVSDILEAMGAAEGEDIADYLLPNNIFAMLDIYLFPSAEKVETSLHIPKEVPTFVSPLDKLRSHPGVVALEKEIELDWSTATLAPLN